MDISLTRIKYQIRALTVGYGFMLFFLPAVLVTGFLMYEYYQAVFIPITDTNAVSGVSAVEKTGLNNDQYTYVRESYENRIDEAQELQQRSITDPFQ